MTRKPSPVVVKQVCDVCGEDWAKHRSENPDLMSCIKVLKHELHEARKRPTYAYSGGNSVYPIVNCVSDKYLS